MKNWRCKLPQISRLRTDRVHNFRLAAGNQRAHRRICADERKHAQLKDISSIFAIVWRRTRPFADAGRPRWVSCRSGLGLLTPTSPCRYTEMKKYRNWLILQQLIGPCWRCLLAWKKMKKRYVYSPNYNELIHWSPSWMHFRARNKLWSVVLNISFFYQFLYIDALDLFCPFITMQNLLARSKILNKDIHVYFLALLLFIVTKMSHSIVSNSCCCWWKERPRHCAICACWVTMKVVDKENENPFTCVKPIQSQFTCKAQHET